MRSSILHWFLCLCLSRCTWICLCLYPWIYLQGEHRPPPCGLRCCVHLFLEGLKDLVQAPGCQQFIGIIRSYRQQRPLSLSNLFYILHVFTGLEVLGTLGRPWRNLATPSLDLPTQKEKWWTPANFGTESKQILQCHCKTYLRHHLKLPDGLCEVSVWSARLYLWDDLGRRSEWEYDNLHSPCHVYDGSSETRFYTFWVQLWLQGI